jgi:hypothetical protein
LLPWQKGEPMYALVPQSVLAVHVIVWLVHEPPEHIWFPVHVVFNCEAVLFEQYELGVPALLQVYVI